MILVTISQWSPIQVEQTIALPWYAETTVQCLPASYCQSPPKNPMTLHVLLWSSAWVLCNVQVSGGWRRQNASNDLSTAYLIQSSILVRCVDINSICKVSSPNALVVDSRSGAQSAWSLFISRIREVKLHAGELMGPLTSQSYIVLGRVSLST